MVDWAKKYQLTNSASESKSVSLYLDTITIIIIIIIKSTDDWSPVRSEMTHKHFIWHVHFFSHISCTLPLMKTLLS